MTEYRSASFLANSRLSPEPQYNADYEVFNWHTATHPASIFRRSLIARNPPEARYALLDHRLSVWRPDGRVERRRLDADGIERALAEVFRLPVEAEWRPVIERASAASP